MSVLVNNTRKSNNEFAVQDMRHAKYTRKRGKIMKKKTVLALLVISSALMLFGCGKGNESADEPVVLTPIIEQIPEDDASEAEETTEQPVDEDVPPEEGMVRSRITNEWVDEEVNNTRPIAIMIPNSNTASQYGISDASVLYECNVEGSMTRLMGIFDDWQNIEKLGNIRSCRDYYVYWAFEWDAIYIHYGGPFYIDDIISRDDTQNVNCITFTDATYRDEAKNSTDNAFTSPDRIKKAMDHYGYPMEYRENYADPQHYMFAPAGSPNTLEQYPNAISASKIDMSKCYPVTNCYFLYNEETDTYDRYQKLSGSTEGPHIDMANNKQLSFKNVIVQNTYHEVRDQKGYLAFQCHDTTRDGYYFTNGKGIHVTWKKESDYGSTRYYDDNGDEVLMNTGKTMVLIVEDGDSFTADDKALTAKK